LGPSPSPLLAPAPGAKKAIRVAQKASTRNPTNVLGSKAENFGYNSVPDIIFSRSTNNNAIFWTAFRIWFT
jgi:hypothetical protein